MEFFFTRHGETDWNVEERIQGYKDIELNAEGIRQAEIARDSVRDEKYDLIISSPLKRARKTADIINQVLNLKIIEDARIMERGFGKSEGLTKAEIRKIAIEHPEIIDVWNYKRNVSYNDMESFQDFAKRVYEFLDETISRYNCERILIVSHGGVFIPMYLFFNHIQLETVTTTKNIPKLKNGEIYKFS